MFFQCLSTLLTWLVLANVLVAVLTVRNMRRCRVELHMNSMLFFDVMNNSRTVAKITIALGTRWHLCTSLTLSCSCYDGISLFCWYRLWDVPSRGGSSRRLAGLDMTPAGSHRANPVVWVRFSAIVIRKYKQAVIRPFWPINDSFSVHVMRFFATHCALFFSPLYLADYSADDLSLNHTALMDLDLHNCRSI